MNSLMIEAINAVGNLNEEMIDQCEEGSDMSWIMLTAVITGDMVLIKFLEQTIWFSEEDEREYIDDGKDEIYEPLEQYLRREINKQVAYISKIKL